MKQLNEILKPYFDEQQTEADITSLLKYINSNRYDKTSSEMGLYPYKFEYEVSDDIYISTSDEDYIFPLKQLYLYTENEKNKLSEILLKIKN